MVISKVAAPRTAQKAVLQLLHLKAHMKRLRWPFGCQSAPQGCKQQAARPPQTLRGHGNTDITQLRPGRPPGRLCCQLCFRPWTTIPKGPAVTEEPAGIKPPHLPKQQSSSVGMQHENIRDRELHILSEHKANQTQAQKIWEIHHQDFSL